MATEFEMYEEAYSCLEQTLGEGQKTANVDIQLMWLNIERCRHIVKQLSCMEQNPFFKGILNNLEGALNSNVDVLKAKIFQLNNGTATGKISKPITSEGSEAVAQVGSDIQKLTRQSAIENTLINKGSLTFKDIAGLTDAKQTLREAIIMPFHFPHLFTGGIKPWKRILLYGPPGTGKSRLAQAISAEINSRFYCVSSSDLVSSWVGESEKLIKELFFHATNQESRSVIFIDEIDSICRQRNSREEEYTRRIKTELLKQMEGADNCDKADKIFLLCATNCPWELDPAFLRRFQKRIYISLPEKDARIELMKIHTKDNNVEFTEEEWSQLGEKTNGFSGSDIANMVLESLFGPIRDLQVSKHWKSVSDGKGYSPCKEEDSEAIEIRLSDLPSEKIIPRQVTFQDFLNAVQTHRRTVTENELWKFDVFTKEFGETG